MYFPQFTERNVQLIGLSIDSVYSHLAWVYNIYKSTGIEIPFPIIADLDMKIAKRYGMISPTISNTSTVRTVFIIDDKQIIRAILQYPMTTGRYIPEILRIIDSLQTVDCDKVVTPANWIPGLPVLVPPPNTYQKLKERVANPEGKCCFDWYLCFTESNKCLNDSKVPQIGNNMQLQNMQMHNMQMHNMQNMGGMQHMQNMNMMNNMESMGSMNNMSNMNNMGDMHMHHHHMEHEKKNECGCEMQKELKKGPEHGCGRE